MFFDPFNAKFKTPFGAVCSGTKVRFSLRPPRSNGYSRGWLTARFEQQDQVKTLPLPWCASESAADVFSGRLDTAGYVGLVWYSFTLEGFLDRHWQSPEYQLTVYDNTDPPPSWFGEGVTYQIFPDRFCRLLVPDPSGMVGGRTVHSDWTDTPDYLPNEHGEIRNRDFFGGSLEGIKSKLPYLKQLGVSTLYLCPVFEGAENHRYGTGDYETIDPMLGSNQDFTDFCQAAHQVGIRIILDGVFNHTGYVSRFFNGDGSYPDLGAAQSQDSPYYKWYQFSHWPTQYESWWGVYSLPAVSENEESYLDYIARSDNSIIRRWLRSGADGWRLDVADELPDSFVHAIHVALREEHPDGILLGEVWEDGSNKIAYGVRRHHLWGGHCDGLMNYPFRTAVLGYLLGEDAGEFRREMDNLREHYPPWAFYGAMNFLGTHDTPRIRTLLGEGGERRDQPRAWRAEHYLNEEQLRQSKRLLKLASLILFAFPGSPTIYYGDEAGMEGFEDPFNRRCYPWGQEDADLIGWYRHLGSLRRNFRALQNGVLTWHTARDSLLAFSRGQGADSLLAAANRSDAPASLVWHGRTLSLEPWQAALWTRTGENLLLPASDP